MPRPREFDPQQALQTAIELFWEKGYADSSVDEVVKRSGVAKYGIYGTFGTKRELFLKALEQYAWDRQHDIQRPIRHAEASLPDVVAFFREAAKRVTQEGPRRGCLVVNTGIELGVRDMEIGNFVRNFFQELAEAIQRCLERAIQKGELGTSTQVADLAAYLATEFRTVLMLAASGHTRQEIDRHLDVALQAF